MTYFDMKNWKICHLKLFAPKIHLKGLNQSTITQNLKLFLLNYLKHVTHNTKLQLTVADVQCLAGPALLEVSLPVLVYGGHGHLVPLPDLQAGQVEVGVGDEVVQLVQHVPAQAAEKKSWKTFFEAKLLR